uniref:Uncharacterized protein n=1 Tax=Cacopsylla melanoneura TaxID=428564 RepID=A0A8D8SHQ0_9HEMI
MISIMMMITMAITAVTMAITDIMTTTVMDLIRVVVAATTAFIIRSTDKVMTKDSKTTTNTTARTRPSMAKKKTKDSIREKMDIRNIITMKETSTMNIITRRKVPRETSTAPLATTRKVTKRTATTTFSTRMSSRRSTSSTMMPRKKDSSTSTATITRNTEPRGVASMIPASMSPATTRLITARTGCTTRDSQRMRTKDTMANQATRVGSRTLTIWTKSSAMTKRRSMATGATEGASGVTPHNVFIND